MNTNRRDAEFYTDDFFVIIDERRF
jgi:hypothetical protein